MHFLLQLLCVPLAYGLYKLGSFLYFEWTSPLRRIPGPPSTHWLYGNFKEIFKSDNSVMHELWLSEYGKTLVYNGFFGQKRLLTSDTKALTHVLMNAYDYPKPSLTRFGLGRILGDGILTVEGDQHKQQRKIMNPAFSNSHIREMTAIFFEKSIQLRDLLNDQITEQGEGVFKTDVLSWLSKLTLDIIGLAGFNYEFNAVNAHGTPNELNEAFNKIFTSAARSPFANPFRFLQLFVPLLRKIPSKEDRDIDHARATMDRIGTQLVSDAKSLVEKNNGDEPSRGKDLLSLLVRANTDVGIPETQRMTEKDVLAQVPTFLSAGHETTSTATTWALFALSKYPDVQKKLRVEVLAVTTDTPSSDELSALTYLDRVVREVLRLFPPVPSTIRVAGQDDALPLKEPYTDRKGITRDSIQITKGDAIFVPLLVMNRDPLLWGDDAREFKPERWEAIPEAVDAIPAVWANLSTFLSGPRSCIGYRFALVEMKAILFTLIRAFDFELAVAPEEIGSRSAIVQRPILKNNLEAGNVMPMLIRPVHT